jgi:subtilisin family serine protease
MIRKKTFHTFLLSSLIFMMTMVFPPIHAYGSNPSDAKLMQQWGWLRIYADVAYSNGYRGNNTTLVAVIDTGIDLDHPDLQENIYTNPYEIPNGLDDDGNGYIDDIHGWNFVDDNNDTGDHDGHGSHCSGIIAGIDNTIGIAGVAPDVQILPIKVIETQSGDLSKLVGAIAYACTMNASVISMSIGSDPDTVGAVLKNKINTVISQAYYGNGTVLVAAAGNTKGGGIEEVTYPACNPLVIAVSATTKSDTLANYSNYGIEVEIAAPGGDERGAILSTYNESNYASLGGTSMACPHVSGVVALILQWNSSMTPDEIRARINSTAIDLGAPGKDILFGHGLISAAACLGLPMSHTYSPALDWIYRNAWWMILATIGIIILFIYSAVKKKPKSDSTYYPTTSDYY